MEVRRYSSIFTRGFVGIKLHQGACSKILRFYWLTVAYDATHIMISCRGCQ
jgi:hypothetical protein